MTTSALDTAKLAIVAGAAVVAFFVVKKVADVAPKALQAINPLNHDNVFATAANDVGAVLVPEPDGPGKNADGSFSWGGYFFDLMHPQTAAQIKDLVAPTAPAADSRTPLEQALEASGQVY